MNNILLTISYDGTDFCGWQRQAKSLNHGSVRTIQGEIECALQKMLKTPIPLQGSGRTDSGVHACAQAANFISPIDSIPTEKYVLALNGLLPSDIRITNAQSVPLDFNARFNATSRVYRYFIHTKSVPQARDTRYIWYIPFSPSEERLNAMASCLKGELDCATFAASGDMSKSTKRYIEKAHFWYEGSLLIFEIEANAFLWKMVRSITGTLIQCERNKKEISYFKDILYSCERSRALFTAPPQGLFLYQVRFDGIRRHI